MQRLGHILMGIVLLSSLVIPAQAAQLSLGSASVLQGQTGTLTLSLDGGTEPYAGVTMRNWCCQPA